MQECSPVSLCPVLPGRRHSSSPHLPLASQLHKYSLGVDTFSVVHEVTCHLKGKAHRIVLPHSFHHPVLVILQEKDPGVSYVPVMLGPVRIPASTQSTLGTADPAFCSQTRSQVLLALKNRRQELLTAWSCAHCGKQSPSACTLAAALHRCHLQKKE